MDFLELIPLFNWQILIDGGLNLAQSIVVLFFNLVILKYIFGKVLDWLKPYFDLVVDPIIAWWWKHNLLRAIVEHYHEGGMQRGHDAKNPLVCKDGKCEVIQ